VSARTLWARVATMTSLALALGLALSPPQPRARMADGAGVAVGAAAGIVLFAALLRRAPVLARLGTAPSALGKQLFLGVCAANEEVLWRRVLLGELLPTGGLTALAVSSAGFALAHRRARGFHLATGLAFGGVYLVTGVLVASIAAHWMYNVLVGSIVERVPP
jgi:membrane protease YdiL (CAAX protease family)